MNGASRDGYEALLDEARAEQAVQERTRERLLRQRAEEEARFAGTLRDLAESGTVVTVRTDSGAGHQGRIVAVGVDHVAVALPRGDVVFVALEAVSVVRPEPGIAAVAATGERDHAQDRTMVEVLTRVIGERPWVAMVVRGVGEPITGWLRAVGEDVVTVRPDGDPRGAVYVPTAAIRELTVR